MSAELVPLPSPAGEPEPATFEDFWLIYARHEAKKDGRKAWDQLSPAEQTACMLGATLWRRNYLARESINYVPLAGTFIRGERFYDEVPAAPTVSSSAHVVFAQQGALPVKAGCIPPAAAAMLAKIKAGRA